MYVMLCNSVQRFGSFQPPDSVWMMRGFTACERNALARGRARNGHLGYILLQSGLLEMGCCKQISSPRCAASNQRPGGRNAGARSGVWTSPRGPCLSLRETRAWAVGATNSTAQAVCTVGAARGRCERTFARSGMFWSTRERARPMVQGLRTAVHSSMAYWPGRQVGEAGSSLREPGLVLVRRPGRIGKVLRGSSEAWKLDELS